MSEPIDKIEVLEDAIERIVTLEQIVDDLTKLKAKSEVRILELEANARKSSEGRAPFKGKCTAEQIARNLDYLAGYKAAFEKALSLIEGMRPVLVEVG